MPSLKHHPDFDDMAAEQAAVHRQANALHARALRHPHPADPDALDEDDRSILEKLDHWEP